MVDVMTHDGCIHGCTRVRSTRELVSSVETRPGCSFNHQPSPMSAPCHVQISVVTFHGAASHTSSQPGGKAAAYQRLSTGLLQDAGCSETSGPGQHMIYLVQLASSSTLRLEAQVGHARLSAAAPSSPSLVHFCAALIRIMLDAQILVACREVSIFKDPLLNSIHRRTDIHSHPKPT